MLSAIIALLLAATALSNPLAPLDQTAKKALRKSQSPGIAIGTFFEGKSTIAVAGVRLNGSEPLVQPSDKWHLGSITKSMTSTLIARLAEKGDLSFDDTIGDVLGKHIPEMNDAYKKVTYRQLVSHRAGLQRDIDDWLDVLLIGKREDRDVIKDRMIIARTILAREPELKPGTKFKYSNVGYIIAGAMIEATTGKTWESLMQRHVFKPLKMKSAGFGAPGGESKKITQPYGHVRLPWGEYYPVDPTKISDWAPAIGPAGQVHANVGDLLKYLDAHRMEDRKFLSKGSWKDLHTPPKGGNYAAGWGVTNGTIWTHTGSNGAWYALVSFSRKAKAELVICSNYYGFGADRIGKAATMLWSKFYGGSPDLGNA